MPCSCATKPEGCQCGTKCSCDTCSAPPAPKNQPEESSCSCGEGECKCGSTCSCGSKWFEKYTLLMVEYADNRDNLCLWVFNTFLRVF